MALNPKEIGYFRGRWLEQNRGQIGGSRNVFVKLQGIKNELVYPTFGGVIRNPFRVPAKMFAGDLCWYKTDSDGLHPDIYLLKTYEVISASTTTININKGGGFRHIPAVGQILMKAPDTIGGTGTGVTISAITETTVTVSDVQYEVWQLTVSANIASSLSKGDVMVEAAAAGSDKKMLVENVNAIIDCDCDFFGNPEITANTNVTPVSGTDDEFDRARYFYTPALAGLMYINKMSPMPPCVLAINTCNVNGWFKMDFLNKAAVEAAKANAAAAANATAIASL